MQEAKRQLWRPTASKLEIPSWSISASLISHTPESQPFHRDVSRLLSWAIISRLEFTIFGSLGSSIIILRKFYLMLVVETMESNSRKLLLSRILKTDHVQIFKSILEECTSKLRLFKCRCLGLSDSSSKMSFDLC